VSRALVLALVATLVVSALLLTGLSATATAGASGASVSPASTPAAVSWTASEYCASDAQPGFLGFVVPYCARGAGYAAPPVVMYNVTGATTGVPVWMSAANNSSGEVVILANSVLTQPTAQPVYDFPTMWAYLSSRGWLNLTAASALGTAPGTFGYDLKVSGGCMAWDPAEHYFLAVAGQDKASGNGWTFTYAPGSNPVPGGTWTNQSSEVIGWAMTSCEMAWDPPTQEMLLYGPALGGTGADFSYWSGNGGWAGSYPTSSYGGPPCAFNATATYDPVSQKVVFFGGSTAGCTSRPSPVLSYTYAWTGSVSWSNLTSSLTVTPPGREWATFATTAFGAVLMGGDTAPTNPSTGALNDTWLFHGQWVQVSLALGAGSGTFCPRYAASAGSLNYTSFLLFGGGTTGTGSCSPTPFMGGLYALNDTWTVEGVASPATNLQSNQTGLPCTDAQLSWTNPTPPYGLSIVNDTVYLYGSSGTLVQTIGTNGPATSVVATGLTCGASYTFRVRGWFSDGAASPLSAALSFLTGSAAGSGQGGGGGASGGGLDLTLIAIVAVVVVAAIAVVGMSARRRRPGGRER
jgi:hypothetical protein